MEIVCFYKHKEELKNMQARVRKNMVQSEPQQKKRFAFTSTS